LYVYRNPEGGESETIGEAVLVELARTGVVTEETPVRSLPDGAWQPAWRVDVLQGAFGLSIAAPAPAPRASAVVAEAAVPEPTYTATELDTSVLYQRKSPSLVLPVSVLMGLAVVFLLYRLFFAGGPVATADGKLQITLPDGWQRKPPGPDLELRAETDGGDTVVLVGSVEILPGERLMTLEAFDYNRMLGTIRESDNFEDFGTQRYQANGMDFFRHDFRGTIHGQDGVYTLTTTRTKNAYYRLVVGTTPKLASSRKATLEAIVRSLRAR